MSSSDNKVIIVLLGGILGVLLVGRDAALQSIGTLFWIGGGLLALWTVWRVIKAVLDVIGQGAREVRQSKEAGQPWIGTALLAVSGPFVLVWASGFLSDKYLGTDFSTYTDLAGIVWCVLLPIILIIRFWEWMRAAHGTLPRFLRAFFRKLGYMALLPVFAPIQRIRELRSGISKPIIGNRFYACVDVGLTTFGALAGWLFFVAAPVTFLIVWLVDLWQGGSLRY